MLSENKDFQLIESAFPHVGSRINLYWGHKEFIKLMDDLIHDTRCEAPRKGFPVEVLFALHSLNELHKDKFPHQYQQSKGYAWC